MSHHRSAALSRCLSTLTQAQLPPRISPSGKPHSSGRLTVFLFALAALLMLAGLIAGLTARAESVNPIAVVTVDAASYQTTMAPNSIASAFGTQLATQVAVGSDSDPATGGVQLPTSLGGTTLEVNGVAAGLLFVSAGQINFIVPSGTGSGTATVVVRSGDDVVSQGTVTIVAAAPTLFTSGQSGSGAPAAIVTGDGIQYDLVGNSDGSTRATQAGYVLVLFGTGVRGAAQGSVHVLIGGIESQVLYAGAQPDFLGLDQINVTIPASLQGRGVVDLVVTVGAVSSNLVNIEIAGAAAGPTPPSVSGFNVASALAGQTITVQGSNFSTTASQNTVRIGSIEAQVTQATASQLTVVVPFGVATGQVKVTTSNGEGQSSSQLPIRTSISGTIQSTDGTALTGATVRLSGTSKLAVSNDQGLFLLSDVTAGGAVVEVDGTTVPANPPYPSITLKMVVSGNRDNQVPQPVSMQQATGASVGVGGSGGSNGTGNPNRRLSGKKNKLAATSVTSNGVTLSIPGTVTFTDGSTTGTVTLTVVDRQRLPVTLPARVFSSTIVQITPFDATFSPSADITFPNNDNIAAGTVVDLYYYDNTITTSGFIKSGTAQVSEDGQTIVGTGVIDRSSIWFAAIPQVLTTTVKGMVASANGNAVRNARVVLRGRNALTDGNGAFSISDLPVKSGEQLTVDVEFLSPSGRALRASKNVTAVPSGVTDAGQISLPAEPSLVLAISPRSLNLVAGDNATLQVASTLPAPTGGLLLNLTKDVPGVTFGSSTVTIPEGESTATFTLTAVTAGKVNIKAATTNNATQTTATILIARPAPVLSGLSPNSGPPSTQIAINGTGFSLQPRQNIVAFEQNGQIILSPLDSIRVVGTASPFLMATVPPLAVGGAQVFVVSLDNNGVPSAASNKLTFAVTAGPQIQSISPNPAEVGTEIMITGTGFSSALQENAVLFSVPFLNVPGSTQPIFAQGLITSATSTELRVRVPGYASSGPVFVVRNPVRKFGQDAGLVRLDKVGGLISQIFLGFNVKRPTNFQAHRPLQTFGNAFQGTANMAATGTRLIAANPSNLQVMLYDISGSNASAPQPMTPLDFTELPIEVAADGNRAIVGLYPPFGPAGGGQQTGSSPAAKIIDLTTGTFSGSIMLSPSVPLGDVKVALTGATALLTVNGTLYLYDVSGANPTPLGILNMNGFVNALAAQGTLALASTKDSVMVIDFSVPGSPVIKSTITDFSAISSGTLPFDFDSHTYIPAVALNGATGIAAVNGAVVTLDLSVPAAPRVLGSAGLHFDDPSFAFNGSTLIVGNQIAGVMLVDINDPTRPFTRSFYDTPSGDPGVLGVASVGNYIYTNEAFSFFTPDSTANNGLISTIQFAGTLSPTPIPYFDVFPVTAAAPGDTITIRGFNLGNQPSDVSLTLGGVTAPVLRANPTSYIPATNITELTVQVPAAAQPTAQGMLHLNLQVGGAAVGYDLGFNGSGSAIKRVKGLSTGTPGVEAITRLGNTPFVAGVSEEVGISIVNTSTGEVASFLPVSLLRVTPRISQFAYASLGGTDYLVICGINESTHAPGVTLVNVSNPAKPFVASETSFAVGGNGSGSGGTAAGGMNFDDHVENLIISGNMAYFHSDVLNILDLTNPSAPVYKGSYQPKDAQNRPQQASGLALTGTNTIALTTFNGSIHLLDVSNPLSVQLLSRYDAPPPQQFEPPVSFNGTIAFINSHVVVAASEFNGKLYFIDFATTANPTLISDVQARASGFVVDTANNLLILSVQEGNPYSSDPRSGDFAVVDITNLTTPNFLGSLNTVGSGRTVLMIGPNVYALADGVDSAVGLQIIAVDPSKFDRGGGGASQRIKLFPETGSSRRLTTIPERRR